MATTYELSTTLVVDIAPSNAVLKAEIDSRPEGYNSGDTSFVAGDEPAYLIYKTEDVIIDSHINTLSTPNGAIVDLGFGTREIEEIVTFVKTDTANVGYPITSGFSYEWLGEDPGVTIRPTGVTALELSVNEYSDPVIGIARINYTTMFTAYRMTNTPAKINDRSDYSVLIYISGHVEA